MDFCSPTTRGLSFLLTLLLLSYFLPTPSSSSRSPNTTSVRCNKQDYEVLMKIKAALHNPYNLGSWVPNTDCCNWNSVVECDSKTNRITRFEFAGTNISFQIPAEVGDLPYLDTLIFEENPNLIGTIPSTITKLKHLKALSLFSNNLSGQIPSFLGQLPKLQYIRLDFNQFSGSIPSSLSSLSKLTYLRVDHNKLTGPIPESFGKFKQLYLYLSHNQLSGVIPKSFRDVNFNTIQLENNKLEGDASMLFKANDKTLWSIDLSWNMFEFDLSKVKFPKNLICFDISHNKIFGSIPEAITGLNMQYLNMSYNGLCGKIPQGGQMQTFDSYSFSHNKCLCDSPLAVCK